MADTHPASADRPRRLLAVVAHPRDAERALGAIVTHWVGQGTEAWLA